MLYTFYFQLTQLIDSPHNTRDQFMRSLKELHGLYVILCLNNERNWSTTSQHLLIHRVSNIMFNGFKTT